MSKEEDQDLERLLATLRKLEPTEFQKTRWKNAIDRELRLGFSIPTKPVRWIGQLAAALATGFLIGSIASPKMGWFSTVNEPVATIQYVFDKTE